MAWAQSEPEDFAFALATVIFCDNLSAVALAKNPQFHGRSKHIDIQHHFVRENIVNGDIVLKYVPTEEQIDDDLIKPLLKVKFDVFRQALGLE